MNVIVIAKLALINRSEAKTRGGRTETRPRSVILLMSIRPSETAHRITARASAARQPICRVSMRLANTLSRAPAAAGEVMAYRGGRASTVRGCTAAKWYVRTGRDDVVHIEAHRLGPGLVADLQGADGLHGARRRAVRQHAVHPQLDGRVPVPAMMWRSKCAHVRAAAARSSGTRSRCR